MQAKNTLSRTIRTREQPTGTKKPAIRGLQACETWWFRGYLAQSGLLGAAHGAEALLELVDTTLGVHELVLTGEEGVRVGGDTAGNHIVLHTIDFLLLGGGSGGTGDEAAARGDVHEHNRIVLGMDVCLHSLTGCVTVAARRDFTMLS